LALDVLEDVGVENGVSVEYWRNLKMAAEIMRLQERYAQLTAHIRLAFASVIKAKKSEKSSSV
jgi:hypothetical protein